MPGEKKKGAENLVDALGVCVATQSHLGLCSEYLLTHTIAAPWNPEKS